MRRRHVGIVIALLLGALAGARLGDGQPARRPFRVAVLHDGYFPNSPSVEGLRAGLRTIGLEEGRDIAFDIRFTRGTPELTLKRVEELITARPDLLFTVREEAARAARTATQTIPTVFVRVGDPVAAGIVASVAQPGGNITGVSSLATELVPKRLEILKAVVPGLRRVWAVYHPDDRSSVAAARKAQQVAPTLKLALVERPVRTPEELVSALRSLLPGDGLLSPAARTMNIPGIILDLQLSAGVPAVFEAAFWVQAGAMLSYGSDDYADGLQAARLVARILGGVRPRDLPVEGANSIELAVNLKTARSLGVRMPLEVLARADRVIE